ncbi:MAG: PEGA domain-containing protein [Kiritimatiellae bacterium]|nr:PEGA domain-containing protein [Kiritimatiellia bacterium]
MRRGIVLLGCLLLAGSGVVHAQPPPTRFDHALYLRVDSTPPHVDIYAPAVSNEPPLRVGRTPCTIAIGFTWAERFGRKQWKSMRVWTMGDVCRLVPAEGGAFDLLLACTARKPGYRDAEIDTKIETLKYPGFQFDLTRAWPTELQMKVDLKLAPKFPEAEAEEKPPEPRVPTMIVATAAEESAAELGTIEIRCNVANALVLVNGRIVGQAPVNLVLPEGTHLIAVQRNGYVPARKNVIMRADKRYRWDADLAPRSR